MPPRSRWLVAAVVALAVGGASACPGGGSKQARDDDGLEDFKCLDRRATYVLAGGFVAPEYGLGVSCTDGPRLVKWTVDEAGARDESTHAIRAAEFNELWRNLEDAGWKNLADCDNPNAKDDDQIYTFEISNGDQTVTFSCQGKELPFPFDRLVNAFDLLAGQFN